MAVRNKNRSIAALMAALALTLALSGCSQGIIKEDSVREDLPHIDPEAGVARDIQAKLFYRLTDEEYLVGVTGAVTVLVGEREERAMIRALIAGTPPLSTNISTVVPPNTQVLDVSAEGAILYVTLSSDFFDTSNMDGVVSDVTRLLENGLISGAEYDARIAEAERELYTARRLAVYSIVNTITASHPDVKVQLLFELDGGGGRVSRRQLGLDAYDGANNDLLEPMGYDESLMITAESLLDCVLTNIKNKEYDRVYPLVAETESGGVQKPDYASFETELSALGSLEAFTIRGDATSGDNGYLYVTADITMAAGAGDGAQPNKQRVTMTLKAEGSVYRVGYRSLLSALGG